MSSHHPDAAAAELPEHDSPKKSAGRRNRRAPWPVVQGVGRSRGVAAAVVTVGMIAAGCGSADGGEDTPTTTSAAAPEESGNPWDLPVEQRPALFDPCTEIPVAAIEEGVGSEVEPAEQFKNSRPGELISCGWSNREVNVVVLSTWKSKDEYLADPAFRVLDQNTRHLERPGLRITDNRSDPIDNCVQLYFTPRGTIWTGVDLTTSLFEFNGQQLSDTCEVLTKILPPMADLFPQGDVQ